MLSWCLIALQKQLDMYRSVVSQWVGSGWIEMWGSNFQFLRVRTRYCGEVLIVDQPCPLMKAPTTVGFEHYNPTSSSSYQNTKLLSLPTRTTLASHAIPLPEQHTHLPQDHLSTNSRLFASQNQNVRPQTRSPQPPRHSHKHRRRTSPESRSRRLYLRFRTPHCRRATAYSHNT